MIIVKLSGGLGNQMFQYAFARKLGMLKKEDVKLDISGYENDILRKYALTPFNISLQPANTEELRQIKNPYGIYSRIIRLISKKIFRQFYIGWKPKVLLSRNKYFDGFWQSYRYFENINKIVIEELALIIPLEDAHADLVKKLTETDSVSLHVRRSDYITDKTTKKYHDICSLDYYKSAIEIMAKNISSPKFFIFSDDINWVKENLKVPYPTEYISGTGLTETEELIAMSKCQHNIIANSTFSWWGAWLNQNPNKIVISPRKWNNRYPKEYLDLLPTNWLKL